MQSFITKGLTASLLAVAVVAGIGRPASAATREPGEDPGGGPIERPTPTRPTTTPRQIESFSVSTDSVVATATLRYNGDPSAATVLWGDGTSSSRCPAGQEGPLHSGCMPNPFDTGDPAGTLVVKHRYAAPANGAPFTVAITGKLGGESQTVAVGVLMTGWSCDTWTSTRSTVRAPSTCRRREPLARTRSAGPNTCSTSTCGCSSPGWAGVVVDPS